MIDDNNLPFEKYLDNYEEDIAVIKLLITGNGPQAEVVCYYFHYN